MDLEARLRAFAAFARRCSFSAAAKELRISQPAVSKHIAEVERETGVQLVVRRPRGGELTPAGEFLANHVLRAHALLAQAARGVGEFRQRVTGSLTVVASGVPATYLLPEVVVAFQRTHPGVRVSIMSGNSAQTMDALRSHRAELVDSERRGGRKSRAHFSPGGAGVESTAPNFVQPLRKRVADMKHGFESRRCIESVLKKRDRFNDFSAQTIAGRFMMSFTSTRKI